MAPIDPLEILSAFSPLLTDNGGIKQVDESQFLHLYSIMKNCSTKLISKCIYCNILMSTNAEVLEEFLKIGGWDLICLWIKASRDEGNVSFLIELLKLLIILPMNISRLRENDCPKVVKKLCKHENQEIALKANQIIKKWTKIIHTFSEKSSSGQSNEGNCRNNNSNSNSNNSDHCSKDKKRKSSDASSSRDNVASSKKLKSIQSTKSIDSAISNNNSNSVDNAIGDSNVNNSCTNSNDSYNVSDTANANLLSDSDPYETFSRDDMNKFMVNTNKEVKVRPVTAKVKQGKFRLDLSAPSTKPSGKAKNKSESKSSKPVEIKKATQINKSIDLMNKLGNGTSSKSSSSHVLKDSMSFMDALSSMPAINKKRRKLNAKDSENAAGSSSSSSSSSSSTFNKVPLSNQEMNNVLLENGSTATNMMQYNTNNNIDTYHNTHNANTNNATNNNSISGVSIAVKSIKNDNLNDKLDVEIKKSPPRFSFYKDILEDKSEDENNNSDSQSGSSIKMDTVHKSDTDNDGYAGGGGGGDDDGLDNNGGGGASGHYENDSKDTPILNQQTELREGQTDSSADQYYQPRVELTQDIDPKSDSVPEMVFNASNADGGANPCPLPPKPILNYIKKGSKKSVRWAEDSKLELVKYFELDETERINVTRSSAEMKRFDMKHEAQMMMDSKKVRCFSYAPWKLIPIDVNSLNAVVSGCNSREREIQAELMKTTLECFYIQNQIPDSPREPDLKFYADSNEQTQIIPLEDENMVEKVQDYSSIQSPVAPDVNGMPANEYDYSATAVPYNNDFNYNPSDNYQPSGNPINVPSNNYTPNLNAPYQTAQCDPNLTNTNSYPPSLNNFDNANNATNNSNFAYNSYSSMNMPPSQQVPANPPISAPFQGSNPSSAPAYQEYSNFMPSSNGVPLPTNQDLPPPLFSGNSNQPINFFNQAPPPSVVDNSYNQPPYWPDNSQPPTATTNFASNGGTMPYNILSGPQSGPRFRPRNPGQGGPSRGRGFHPRGPSSDVCRFFSKYGKCKFDQRCNFSHILDNSKPIRF